jgi:hypothetical protein
MPRLLESVSNRPRRGPGIDTDTEHRPECGGARCECHAGGLMAIARLDLVLTHSA